MFLGVKHAQKRVRRDKKAYVLSDKGHRCNFVELRRQKMRLVELPHFSDAQSGWKVLGTHRARM